MKAYQREQIEAKARDAIRKIIGLGELVAVAMEEDEKEDRLKERVHDRRVLLKRKLTKDEMYLLKCRIVDEMTLQQIGDLQCVSRERIRQKLDSAFHKLRLILEDI